MPSLVGNNKTVCADGFIARLFLCLCYLERYSPMFPYSEDGWRSWDSVSVCSGDKMSAQSGGVYHVGENMSIYPGPTTP